MGRARSASLAGVAVERRRPAPGGDGDQTLMARLPRLARVDGAYAVQAAANRSTPATSSLYARNLLNFLGLMFDAKTGEFKLNREDEIIAGTLVCADGELVKKG